jgi:hypothetical protein
MKDHWAPALASGGAAKIAAEMGALANQVRDSPSHHTLTRWARWPTR